MDNALTLSHPHSCGYFHTIFSHTRKYLHKKMKPFEVIDSFSNIHLIWMSTSYRFYAKLMTDDNRIDTLDVFQLFFYLMIEIVSRIYRKRIVLILISNLMIFTRIWWYHNNSFAKITMIRHQWLHTVVVWSQLFKPTKIDWTNGCVSMKW